MNNIVCITEFTIIYYLLTCLRKGKPAVMETGAVSVFLCFLAVSI